MLANQMAHLEELFSTSIDGLRGTSAYEDKTKQKITSTLQAFMGFMSKMKVGGNAMQM